LITELPDWCRVLPVDGISEMGLVVRFWSTKLFGSFGARYRSFTVIGEHLRSEKTGKQYRNQLHHTNLGGRVREINEQIGFTSQ
jgi:hypothetical protein